MTMRAMSELSDRQVMLILGQLDEELREKLKKEGAIDKESDPQTQDEVRQILADFLKQVDQSPPNMVADDILPEKADAYSAGRVLLMQLRNDPIVGPRVEVFLAKPPDTKQMSAIDASHIVVLGLLVTLLQTRITWRFKKSEREKEIFFEFKWVPTHVVIKSLVDYVKGLFQ